MLADLAYMCGIAVIDSGLHSFPTMCDPNHNWRLDTKPISLVLSEVTSRQAQRDCFKLMPWDSEHKMHTSHIIHFEPRVNSHHIGHNLI